MSADLAAVRRSALAAIRSIDDPVSLCHCPYAAGVESEDSEFPEEYRRD
jgi:hypothetical protein